MSFWKGDAIATGMELATSQVINAQRSLDDTRHHLEVVQRLVKQRDHARSTNAANYCEKHALRVALAKLDPNHPLITNKALQEKIQNTGERVLAISDDDWDSVAEAGRTFRY